MVKSENSEKFWKNLLSANCDFLGTKLLNFSLGPYQLVTMLAAGFFISTHSFWYLSGVW